MYEKKRKNLKEVCTVARDGAISQILFWNKNYSHDPAHESLVVTLGPVNPVVPKLVILCTI